MTDYFISDAHLYPSWKDHPGRASLHGFLAELAGKDPGGLWILGDLFDYWFEYRGHMPAGYTDTLRLLRDLEEKGWKTRFIPGNHDWWCGEHLRESSGMKIIRDTIHTETIQGHRCLMAHGDGLGRGDTGYRLIRPVLRANFMKPFSQLFTPPWHLACNQIFQHQQADTPHPGGHSTGIPVQLGEAAEAKRCEPGDNRAHPLSFPDRPRRDRTRLSWRLDFPLHILDHTGRGDLT